MPWWTHELQRLYPHRVKTRTGKIPFHVDTLLDKKRHGRGSHAYMRLTERLPNTRPSTLRGLETRLSKTPLPRGTHHVPLDGGAVVLKDIGNKHVVATVLGPGMSRPGRNVSLYLEKRAFLEELVRLVSQ